MQLWTRLWSSLPNSSGLRQWSVLAAMIAIGSVGRAQLPPEMTLGASLSGGDVNAAWDNPPTGSATFDIVLYEIRVEGGHEVGRKVASKTGISSSVSSYVFEDPTFDEGAIRWYCEVFARNASGQLIDTAASVEQEL